MAHEHYYPKKDPVALAPKLIYTGCVSDDPQWFNTPHHHDFCEILYVSDGSGSIEISGESHTIKCGDLIIVNAGVTHAERSDPDHTLHLIFVGVDQVQLDGLPENHLISEECEKIKAYIDTHYTSNITLESLSEAAYISKHHLAHVFKKQAGVSPIRYMIERRIEQAKTLLVQTDIPVREIAVQVGYPDSVYFSQIFKKITGYSPLTYRREHK